MKKILCLLVVILSFGMLSSCKGNELTKIELAEVTHSIFYAPLYVGINKGYFEEAGLDLTLVNAGGADKVTAALLSGDSQIGLAGPETTIYVYLNGQTDYMINFAQLTKRDGSFIVGRGAEEFTIQSLKGKTILGGRKAGMPEMTLEYVIKEAGLTVGRDSDNGDVKVRTDIQFTAMAGAFLSGEGDYTTLFEPTATMLENEGKAFVLASVGELSGEIPYTAFYTSKSYMTENPDTIKAFTSALAKSQAFVMSSSDIDVAKELVSFFTDSSIDDLTKVVARYRNADVWCDTPFFKEAGLERLMDVMTEAGELEKRVPFAKIVDNRFASVVQAEKE